MYKSPVTVLPYYKNQLQGVIVNKDGQIVQIASNAIHARLYNAPREVALVVSNLLSYKVNGAEHTKAFKIHKWDGRSSFFSFKTQSFPAGFVQSVQSHLVKRGYRVQLIRKPLPVPLGKKGAKIDDFPDDPNYDYQPETVETLIRRGMMIAQVATGGGKSRIARMAFERIRRTTLFLTTRSVLMYQMKDSFEQHGRKVGVLGDGEWTALNGINVGMVQTLAARLEHKTVKGEIDRFFENLKAQEDRQLDALKKKLKGKRLVTQKAELDALKKRLKEARPKAESLVESISQKVIKHNIRRDKVIKLLEKIEFVILEEAHESGGNSYYDVMQYCKNAHYRLSLTGTPFMKEDEEANMRLMAVSGPIGIRISEKLLIDRGILAKPVFKYIDLGPPPGIYDLSDWPVAYKKGIVENEERNRHIIAEARRAVKFGLPVMVLVQHTAHGRLLRDEMKRQGIKVKFIYGKHEQDQRKEALQQLGSGEIEVLIGSTILDVGVDVPVIGLVILAGAGKAQVALRQRIGRGLRKKKVGPNIALILDFNDRHNMHLTKHTAQRKGIIDSIEGFAENVLPSGQDFDYSVFKKAA